MPSLRILDYLNVFKDLKCFCAVARVEVSGGHHEFYFSLTVFLYLILSLEQADD